MKKWILGFLALVVLLALAGFWWMRENPLRLYELTTRRALERAGLELRSFEASSGSLAYWTGGDGPTLVLLHGAGDQAGAFQGIAAPLLEGYRLLIPDIPGHGESEPGEGTLPMSLMYGGIEEFVDALGGDQPPTLIGSSMGAWISMLYAHRHPERVARVIAINGGPLVGDRPDLSLTPADREAARELMAAIRDPSSPPAPDFLLDDIVERSAAGPMGRISAEVADLTAHLLEGKLGEVTVPVELVWGESDRLLSLAYAERMLAGLPRARLTTLPGCGHIPANECPEKLAATLTELLAEPPPGPTVDGAADAAEEDAMTGTDLLTHVVRGEGEPLLLLNGGMMTYASWEPLSSRLAERYRVVLCDLRGQLLSPGSAPEDLAGNVADLTALLDHLEIDSAHVIGTSYGGAVAVLMAALAPERVRSLIAITVGERTTGAQRESVEELRRLIRAGLAGGDKGEMHDHLVAEVYSSSYLDEHGEALAARRAQVAALPDVWYEGVSSILSAVEHLDMRPLLGDIRCPTLVVVAGEDQAIPAERSSALAAGIAGARVVTHDSSGHALIVEDPEWLAEATLGFLDSLKERSDV